MIPIVELAAVLDLPQADSLENKLVVVLGLRGQKVGIIVDDIDDIQEIVVKPLGALFSSLKLFSGNTILGDGAVILIIDPAGVAAAINVEKGSSLLASESQRDTGAAAPSSLILFRAGPGAAKVIPRSVVSRILRVPASQIHQADGHRLYRYQGKLIPVLPVAESCENAGHCLVLVITLYERTFGLWVDSVMDIVENTAEIQLRSNSNALLGTIDLRGEAVEFVDVCYYYRMAFQEPAERSSQAKTNVLIVDEQPGMRDLLTPLLASAGHKVTVVETAEQANKLLEQLDFGVILLDSNTARRIEVNAMSRQAQALCLIFDDDRHQGGRSGDNLVSLFDRHRLLKTIASHLDRRPEDGLKAANLNLSASSANQLHRPTLIMSMNAAASHGARRPRFSRRAPEQKKLLHRFRRQTCLRIGRERSSDHLQGRTDHSHPFNSQGNRRLHQPERKDRGGGQPAAETGCSSPSGELRTLRHRP